MKASIITSALALLTTSALAVPAPASQARQFEVSLTFHGAADASYSLTEPADGSIFFISTFSTCSPRCPSHPLSSL